VPIPAGCTHFAMQRTVIEEGVRLLADWIASGGKPSPPLEPLQPADYTSFPTRTDIAAFYKSGHRLYRDREFWRTFFSVK